MREGYARPDQVPLELPGVDYTRPYYRLNGFGPEGAPEVARRFSDVLTGTVARAIADAGLQAPELHDMPVFFGSTAIDIPLYEEAYRASSHILSNTSAGYGNIANDLADTFDLRAGCYTFTTACTSSANGILYAADMIRNGLIDRALVIGYDLFSNLGFLGFESLKLISSSR